MPFYPPLKIKDDDKPARKRWKRRTAEQLLALRAALRNHLFAYRDAEDVPTHNRDDQKWLRIATWNLREFDTDKYGGRREEALYYIAEIISNFDVVAVQEVREDRNALRKVMDILGYHDWEYIATDVTEGDSGNGERMVFIYNKKKSWFRGIAGEVTLEKNGRVVFPHKPMLCNKDGLTLELPEDESLQSPKNVPTYNYRGDTKLDGDLTIKLPEGTWVQLPRNSKLHLPHGLKVTPTGEEGRIELDESHQVELQEEVLIDLPTSGLKGDHLQFARTPFLVAFQAGWLKFMLCTVHIYYGKGKKGLARRNAEIKKLTEFLAERARNENDTDADNYFFVLGDFNIVGKNHETMESLESNGFKVPKKLKEIPKGSNVKRDKAYDQIAYWAEVTEGVHRNARIEVGNADIFDYFKYVFRMGNDDPDDVDEKHYETAVAETNLDYKEWRTYQMSDHLPMWIELKIDFSDEYLRKIAE